MTNPYARLSVVRIMRTIEAEPKYEGAADIIADIMHYCDAYGVPFEQILNQAQGYYDADLEDVEDVEDA